MPSALISKQREINLYNIIFFITIVVIIAFSEVRILSVSSLALFVSFSIVHIIKKKKIKITIHFVWMGLFIFWAFIISLFSFDIVNSTAMTLNLFLKFLFYTCLLIFFDNKEKIILGIKVLIMASIILFIRLIIITPVEVWGTERLGFTMNLNTNTIGMISAYASISSIFLAKKFENKYYYIIIVPFLLITLFTGSRKAFLIFVIGIVLLFLLYSKTIKSLIINTASLVIFILFFYKAVFNIPIIYNVIGKRLESFINIIQGDTYSVDASMNTRIRMIDEAFMFIKEKPLLGYGLENYSVLSTFGTYSHNNYTEILFSTGIIGFLIYYSMPFIILMSSIVKRLVYRNNDYNLIIVLLSIILIIDIGIVSYSHLITQLLIVINLGYYLVLSRKEKEYEDLKIQLNINI